MNTSTLTVAEHRAADLAERLQHVKLNARWKSEHFHLLGRVHRAVALGDLEPAQAVLLISKHGPDYAVKWCSDRGIYLNSATYQTRAPLPGPDKAT